MASYSKEEIKSFEEKDLRISKLAILKSLIEKYPDVNDYGEFDVPKMLKLADKFIDYVYGRVDNGAVLDVCAPGLSGDDIDWSKVATQCDVVEPAKNAKKVLDLLWGEYRKLCSKEQETQLCPFMLCQSIIRFCGKYPVNVNSVGKVMSVIKLESILKGN